MPTLEEAFPEPKGSTFEEAFPAGPKKPKTESLGEVALHGAVGLSDVITSIPTLLGAIGAGAEAGFNKLTGPDDPSGKGFMGKGGASAFLREFGKAASSGVDRDLLVAGAKARRNINEVAGLTSEDNPTGEPRSTPAQIARFFSLVPNPASLGTKVLGKGGNLALNLLTPAVKFTKSVPGTAARIGAQGALVTGAEQLNRRFGENPTGLPLIGSEFREGKTLEEAFPGTDLATALGGADFDPELAAIQAAHDDEQTKQNAFVVGGTVAALLATIASGRARQVTIGKALRSDTVSAGSLNKLDQFIADKGTRSEFNLPSRQEMITGIKPRMKSVVNEDAITEQTLRELGYPEDVIESTLGTVERVRNIETELRHLVDTGELSTPSGTVRMIPLREFRLKVLKLGEEKQLLTDTLNAVREMGTRKRATVTRLRAFFGDFNNFKVRFDENALAFTAQREIEQGAPPGSFKAEQLPESLQNLSREQVDDILNTLDDALAHGSPDAAMAAIDAIGDPAFDILKKWIAADGSILERVAEGLVKPGLYRSSLNKEGRLIESPVPDEMLNDAIGSGLNNPAIKEVFDDFQQIGDAIGEFLVKMDVFDPTTMAKFRNTFRQFGDVTFIPGREGRLDKSLIDSFTEFFSIHTDTGGQMDELLRFAPQGNQAGTGIRFPADPLSSIEEAIVHAINHGRKQAAQYSVYDKLVGGIHGYRIPDKTDVDAVRVIGTSNPEKLGPDGRALIQKVDDPFLEEKGLPGFGSGDAQLIPLEDLMHRNVIWIQREGKFVGIFDPNNLRREVMRYNPLMALNPLTRLGQHSKNFFSSLTVGMFSPAFAPISAAFTQQNISINALLRGGSYAEAFVKMPIRSVKASARLFSEKMASDFADRLSIHIAESSGLARIMNPQQLGNLRDYLQRTVSRSVYGPLRMEGVNFGAGLSTSDVSKINLDKMIRDTSPVIAERLAGKGLPRRTLNQFFRAIRYANEALHEGPTAATALHKLSGIPRPRPDQVTAAGKFARDIAGDPRRKGAGGIARGAQLTIPFYGAMMQSWRSIGTSALKNPDKVADILFKAVGIPTGIEVAYLLAMNELFPEMGYLDWYLNSVTPEYRNANYIWINPGQPPQASIVVPLFPELGLARALFLDSFIGVFNIAEELGIVSNEILPGAVGQMGIPNLSNSAAGFRRVFDLQFPIPIEAGVAAATGGGSLSATLPGEGTGDQTILGMLNPLSSRVAPQGETLSMSAGKNRNVGDFYDITTMSILSAIGGGAAGIHLAFVEGAVSGSRDGFLNSIGTGIDAAGEAVKKQARYLAPLWFNAGRPRLNDDVAKELFPKTNHINQLVKANDLLRTQGFLRSPNVTDPLAGSSLTQEVPTEPIEIEMAAAAPRIKEELDLVGQDIVRLRADIANIRNSPNLYPGGPPATAREKQDELDTKIMQIRSLRSAQNGIIKRWEDELSISIGEKLGQPNLKIHFGDGRTPPKINSDILRRRSHQR